MISAPSHAPAAPRAAARVRTLMWRGGVVLAVAATLGACDTTRRVLSEVPSHGGGTSGEMPTYQVGDRLIYDEPSQSREVIQIVDKDVIRWRLGNGTMSTTRNPFVPPFKWAGLASGGGGGTQQMGGSPDRLFPLRPHNRVTFTSQGGNERGATWTLNWTCSVAGAPNRTQVPAGTFDTWEVTCSNEMMRQVYAYAPKIGYWVQKQETRQGQNPVTVSLVDFRRYGLTPRDIGGGGPATAGGAGQGMPPSDPYAQPQQPPVAVMEEEDVFVVDAPGNAAGGPREIIGLNASETVVNADGSSETLQVTEVEEVYYDRDPSGAWGIQVGSFRAPTNAETAREQLEAQYPGFFSGMQFRVAEATIPGRGEFFRLITGPFTSKAEAARKCANFKSRGHDCLPKPFPR